MKPFAFRQRIGALNWKEITAIDLEIVIDQHQIEELQSIIDDVIFSNIQVKDIRGASILDLKKLVNIMQLMLEYLLYCQESQLTLIQELYRKNKQQKRINKELNETNETIKEDIRIYKRQISSLKSSIEKYKQMVLKNDGYVAVAPRIFNPLAPSEEQKDKGDKQETTNSQLSLLIESMLRHERQTRDYVKDILDEQRASLGREFDRMASRTDNDRTSSLAFEQSLNTYIDRITQKIEHVALTAANAALKSIPPASSPSTAGVGAEMEFRLQEISMRERRLLDRERELQDKLYDFEMKVKSFERQQQQQLTRRVDDQPPVPIALPQGRSIGVNTVPLDLSKLPSDEVYRKGIALASHLLARKISPGATLQLQHSFQRWKNKVFHYILKLNKSLLQQQDLSTHDFIEYKKALEQKNKDHSMELKKYQELNQELEKKIAILSKTPPPAPPVVIEVKKKRKTQGDGLSEVQLMADALLRIQESMRGVVETDEEIMDELADELLERVQIRDDGEEDEEPEEEEEEEEF